MEDHHPLGPQIPHFNMNLNYNGQISHINPQLGIPDMNLIDKRIKIIDNLDKNELKNC